MRSVGLAALVFLAQSGLGPVESQSAPYEELARVPVLVFEPPEDVATVHNRSDRDYLDYAWRSFIALSWPAQPGAANRGEPDVATIPGSRAPLVWETWPYTDQVFLPSGNWNDYPIWEAVGKVSPDFPNGPKQPPIPKVCPPHATDVICLSAINQPGLSIQHGAVGPLFDQHGFSVRYQVGLNRSYFEYVRSNQYYQAEKQAGSSFVPLPHDEPGKPGMIEYKSAWKVLSEEEIAGHRFYTRKAYYIGLPSLEPTSVEGTIAGTPFTVGLVAFHIHRRTYLSHFASTFEQVDNVQIEASYLPHTPSFNPGLLSADPPPYGKKGYTTRPPLVRHGNFVRLQGRSDPKTCPELTATCASECSGPCPQCDATSPPACPSEPPNVSRATPLSPEIQEVNERYQEILEGMGSVMQYYQLIGTQHVASDCSRNWQSGKWSPGCPKPSSDILINAALESYTQLINLDGRAQNYSCQGCHQNARPCGVSWEKVPEFEGDLMSFLLSKAKKKDTTYCDVLNGYNCNRPGSDCQ